MTRWPKVEARSNENGDWSVVEEGGKVIADLSKGSGQHARLVRALAEVCDVAGILAEEAGVIVEPPAITRARSVLAADSGCGASETDSETQERNAKRIAAGLNTLAECNRDDLTPSQIEGIVGAALADAEDAG